MPIRLNPLSLALGTALAATLLSATPVRAQSLLEVYDAARQFDATYLAARSQAEATKTRATQAMASVLPTVNLGIGVNQTRLDGLSSLPNPPTTVIGRSFPQATSAITASQPLFRPANWATYEQGQRQLDIADQQLAQAEQDLIVRVSQAYFDVLAAQDSLAFVKAQKQAISEQLASARRNFEVGTATITDTREAQARFDLATAQELAAENDLRIKRLALDTLAGRTIANPRGLAQPVRLPTVTPANVEEWASRAAEQHPSVRLADVALSVAKLETEKAKAGNLPTVDLTANVTRNNQTGSAINAARLNSTSMGVGVQLNYPLFAGYAIQGRIAETVALEDKARTDLEGARRSVAQATRTAFFGVVSGQAQVAALEAAEASSQVALDANRLGYQVGVRINIDVLNSQSQLFQTRRDLAQARYNVLIGGLRLRQASGSLTANDLQNINALLVR
jgi:outer membrane protein